jgi:hypothetical protein
MTAIIVLDIYYKPLSISPLGEQTNGATASRYPPFSTLVAKRSTTTSTMMMLIKTMTAEQLLPLWKCLEKGGRCKAVAACSPEDIAIE